MRSTREDVTIRDAEGVDVSALAAIRYNEALHRDRVRDADGRTMRYLVVESGGTLVGFGVLVLGQPPTWPTMRHLPQMIDLNVREDLRGRGLGSRLIRRLEELARESGCDRMFLGVDPADNSRAMALYARLGYEPVDPEPVEDRWEFTDSDGIVHKGVEHIIHMMKPLR